MSESVHEAVLLSQVIDGLKIQPNDIVVDGTAGGGGHAKAILQRLSKKGMYVGIDLDSGALARVEGELKGVAAKVVLVENNYRNLKEIAADLGLSKIDRVLIDLGLSSDQLEKTGRGFTFSKEEPLLMTFKESPKPDDVTAYDVVNTWSEKNLADIIYGFGEEKRSRKIAKAITDRREVCAIETSWELAELIREAVGGGKGRIHPATLTFQAIRMAVNDELGSLAQGLEAARALLGGEGRVSVISFESVTDRLVKTTFRAWQDEGDMRIVTKRPLVATEDELRRNPRSRSAKLRIAEKVASGTTSSVGQ